MYSKFTYIAEIVLGALLLPVIWVSKLLGKLRPKRSVPITIFGWYGKETVGDVAILGQVIFELLEMAPGASLFLITQDQDRCQDSLEQLDLEDKVTLVPATPLRSAWTLLRSEVAVLGGGPLMDSLSMPFWLARSALLRLSLTRLWIYGCGVGPLHSRFNLACVSGILKLANKVILRDASSYDRLPNYGAARTVTVDPAYHYVEERCQAGKAGEGSSRKIGFALREPQGAYLPPGEEGAKVIEQLKSVVRTGVDHLLEDPDIEIHFWPMCTSPAAHDDRAFVHGLLEDRVGNSRITLHRWEGRVPDVLNLLRELDAVVGMRFHGVVFSAAAGLPLVCIDYDYAGGKVAGFCKRVGLSDSVMPIMTLNNELFIRQLDRLRSEPDAMRISNSLRAELSAESGDRLRHFSKDAERLLSRGRPPAAQSPTLPHRNLS